MLLYVVFLSLLLIIYTSGTKNTSHGFSIQQEVSKLGLTIMLWGLIAILLTVLILWLFSVNEFVENKKQKYYVLPGEGKRYDIRLLYNEIFGIKYRDIPENKSAPLYEFWKFMREFVDNNGTEILLIFLSSMTYSIIYLLYINYKEIELSRTI